MRLTDGQRAMIYLVAKGLRNQDFCAFMQVSPVRAYQLLRWYPGEKKNFNWSKKTKEKVLNVTNGGLDVDSEVWTKIERMLFDLKIPDVNYKSLEASKELLKV